MWKNGLDGHGDLPRDMNQVFLLFLALSDTQCYGLSREGPSKCIFSGQSAGGSPIGVGKDQSLILAMVFG